MRILTKILALLPCLFLAGCPHIQVQKKVPEPRLAHPYKSFPQTPTEVKNLNPDRDGDPWMAGGLILPTDEELKAVPAYPQLPSRARSVGDLPSLVDNSKNKFFRGIFAQKHGSCAQASAIAYVYGYEVNRMRGTDGRLLENKFPTHWTYNFVNNGYDRGSWMMWGWEVAKSMGVPNAKVYGTETGFDLKYWPSKYEVYENAIDSRVDKYFLMTVANHGALNTVKRFLWNHGSAGGEGGILSFAAGWSTGYAEAVIPEGQHGAGKKLIKSFGRSVNHAVTFVGYDDKICHDFDGDQKCTNDKDLNGDGKIDLKDWEVGAFIMANSWGTRWGNQGFIYVPYRLAALDPADGGIYRQYVYGVVPAQDKDKTLVLKVQVKHDKRNQLKFQSAYQKNQGANGTRYFSYYGLTSRGGAFPLNGSDGSPVDFGLDLRPLLGNENLKKSLDLSSVIDSLGGGVGEVLKVSVVDYMNEHETFASGGAEIEKGRNTVKVVWDPDGDPDPEPEPEPEPEPRVLCEVGPVAMSGLDMTVGEHCALVLNGTESFDPDGGKIVKYLWRQVSGPQKIKILDADTGRAVALIPSVKQDEKYVFSLTVVDDKGYADSDLATIVVKNRFDDDEE